ncbi:hypothetical protein D3C87_854710 [compost metagenome]
MAVIVKERHPRIGRADDHTFDIAGNMAALGLLPAPPGGDGGQLQFLAQNVAADARHEGEQRPRFENAAAKCVDDGQRFIAQRLHHARRADMGLLVEFQRIGIGSVQTPPENADGFEPRHGSDHDAAVDDGEVLALQQHEAEITGDIGVFEIGLVGGAGRQHRDAVVRVFPVRLQRIAESAEKRRQTVHMGFRVDVGQCAGGRHPVFKRETRTGRRLRPVGQHPPVSIGAAADFKRAEMQIMAACRFYADHGPQIFRIGSDQCRRHVTFLHQPVFAVEIGDHGFQKIGALFQPFGKDGPFPVVDQHGNMGDRPVSFAAALAVIAVEHAGIAQITVCAGKTLVQFPFRHARQGIEQVFPDRPHLAVGIEHFVSDARQGGIFKPARLRARFRFAFRCRGFGQFTLRKADADRASAEILATRFPPVADIALPYAPMVRNGRGGVPRPHCR